MLMLDRIELFMVLYIYKFWDMKEEANTNFMIMCPLFVLHSEDISL